jgi:ATP-dependent DNA ligase
MHRPEWVHEIKHDGYRLMARRDPVGIRLLTRNGHDWSPRYPLIVEAVNRLKARSCLIDGEVGRRGSTQADRYYWSSDCLSFMTLSG